MKDLDDNALKLPDGQSAKDKESVILNNDVEFENREVDPGFMPVSKSEDSDLVGQQGEVDGSASSARQGAEQGTDRNAPGLGELDGTNPGPNHHPMDNEGV